MAYDEHTRFQFGGTLGDIDAPVEIWSCTFNTNRTTAPDSGTFEDIKADIVTFFNALDAMLSTSVHLGFIKQSLCDDTNHVVGAVMLDESNLASGAGGGPSFPPQCAIKITLKAEGRGRSKFGGFYMPLLAMAVNADELTVSEANANTVLAAAENLLAAVFIDGGGVAVVASGVLGNQAVNEVRVGRVVDTIRRRRNELPENYVSSI